MIIDQVRYEDGVMPRAMNRLIDNVGRELLVGFLLIPDDAQYFGFRLEEENTVSPVMLFTRDRNRRFYPDYKDNSYDVILQLLACDDECFYFQCATFEQANAIILALRYMPKANTTCDLLRAMNAKVQN
jgi:hypothetical protein